MKQLIKTFSRRTALVGPAGMFLSNVFEKTFRFSFNLVWVFLFATNGLKESAWKDPKVEFFKFRFGKLHCSCKSYFSLKQKWMREKKLNAVCKNLLDQL